VSDGGADPITRSLEIAAERGGDLTPLVYARLFKAQPEMERLFWRDHETHAVRGEMLARVIDAILDFSGDRAYARALIQCEVITHEGYDVPPEIFGTFFRTVRDSVREVCGADWDEAMAQAWAHALRGLEFYADNPDQYTVPEKIGLAAEAS
jgi:hemoglobin-like flavoprotein